MVFPLSNGKQWSIFLCLLLCMLSAKPLCTAQQVLLHDYDMRRISLRDGLVDQAVTVACKDERGMLWLGTSNGLFTYDGFRISRYDLPGMYSRQLPDYHITDLEVIEGADIILVCTPRGACAIDPMERTNIPEWDLGIRDGRLSRCLQFEKSTAGFYFGYYPGMVCRVDWHKPKQLVIDPWFAVDAGSELKMISDRTRSDAVWLLPKASEAWYATPGEKYNCPVDPVSNNSPIVKGLVSIAYDRTSLYGWDGAWNLYTYNPDNKRWGKSAMALNQLFPALKSIEAGFNHKVMVNAALSLGTEQTGLCTNAGMYILRKKVTAFHAVPELVNQEIRGIYSDSSGRWWASAYNGTYTGRIRSKSEFRYYPALSGVCSFLPIGNNTCFLAFETNKGVGKWDFRSNRLLKNTIVASDISGVGEFQALSLCRDFQGGVWAGCFQGVLHNSANAPDTFRTFVDASTGNAFHQSLARTILSDRDSSLWIGTENGLYHLIYNISKARFEEDPSSPYAKGVVISGLYQDRFSNLWVATKGNGIACRYKRGHWRWLTTDNGLSNNVTCRIEGSNQDLVMWISTRQGLSRFDIASGTFCNYFEENGLPFDEFNTGSSAREPDGTLFFGGPNGLMYFKPDSVPVLGFHHQTIIPSVMAYSSRYDTLITFSMLDKPLSLWPYPEYVEILLGADEYLQRDKIRFRYRMLGISDNWNFTNGEREIKYFKLPPGKYRFEVQVWLPGGRYGEPAFLSITVLKPFYESYWFIAFLIFKSLLLAHLIYLLRVRRVLKEQQIRRQIADDLHDDIGNKLNIVSILAQKISRVQDSANDTAQQTSLQKLVGVTKEALMSLHTMIWTVDPTKDKLVNLLNRMEDFADDFLRPLNIVFSFRFPAHVPEREISLNMRHHLILIYQELLMNMIKYSPPVHINFVVTLSEAGKFELEILNEHRPNIGEYDLLSGRRGLESLKRRLEQVGGELAQTESGDQIQKTNLIVYNIYKK